MAIVQNLLDKFADIASHAVLFISDNWIIFWPLITAALILVGFHPTRLKGDETFAQSMLIRFRRLLLFLPFFVIIFSVAAASSLAILSSMNPLLAVQAFTLKLAPKMLWIIPTIFASLFLKIWIMRKVSPWLSQLQRRLTKKQKFDELSDIRNVNKSFSQQNYDPTVYYKSGCIFLGLDTDTKPIHVDIQTFRENHLQIIGATGFGKGVLLGCIIDQLIIAGDTVFYFDPKHDENLPFIMQQRCKDLGRNFEYLSLFDDEPGTWNPCLGGSIEEARSRLESAIKLGKTGSDADHYKTKERLVLANAFAKSRDLESIAQLCEDANPDSTSSAELKLWRKYRSLCPKGAGSFSVESALTKNSVVYVKGSLNDDVMLACFAMLMTELGQVAARLKGHKKHAFAFWDEVSFYIVPEIPKSLASIRSSGLTFGLAYQSQSDTKNLRDRNVNGEYVFNGVNTNCQLKLVYGGWDDATTSWISKLCGTVRKEVVTSEELTTNAYAAQVWSGKQRAQYADEPLLPTNMLKMLPKRVCVFLRPGTLPSICSTAWVPVRSRELALTHALPAQEQSQTTTSTPRLSTVSANRISL